MRIPGDFRRYFTFVYTGTFIEYFKRQAAFLRKKGYIDKMHTRFESDKSVSFIKKSRLLININLSMHHSNIFKNTLFLFLSHEFLIYIQIPVYPVRHFGQLREPPLHQNRLIQGKITLAFPNLFPLDNSGF